MKEFCSLKNKRRNISHCHSVPSSSNLLPCPHPAYTIQMHIPSNVAIGLLASVATATSDNLCGTSPSSHELSAVFQNHRKGNLGVQGAWEHVSIDTYVHVIGASDKVEDGYITVSSSQCLENAHLLTILLLDRTKPYKARLIFLIRATSLTPSPSN